MKKIVFLILLAGLFSQVYAADDFLFETVVIPSYSSKNVSIEQNDINNNVEVKGTLNTAEQVNLQPQRYVEGNIYYPVINMLGKFNNEIKIVYTDIDGIITPNFSNDLDDSIYLTIEKLVKNNIPVIFTTGRTFREAKKVANELNISPKYYITQNGAEIVDENGKVLSSELLTIKEVKKLNHELKWFNYFYNKDLKIIFYIDGHSYMYRNSDNPELMDYPVQIEKLSQLPQEGASKISIYSINDKNLAAFKRYLKRVYPTLNINTVSKNMLDITATNATKAKAVDFVANKMGINIKNSAAFGYSETDESMLNSVRRQGGLAISTDESVEDVKLQSSYITKDVEFNGYAFAIDTILGNNLILNSENEE